jgi:hypothetical protein
MQTTLPTHSLSVLNKTDSSRCTVGAGWLNPDGSISISLNPCVNLTKDSNIVIRLFPVKNKEEQTMVGKKLNDAKKYINKGNKSEAKFNDEEDPPF